MKNYTVPNRVSTAILLVYLQMFVLINIDGWFSIQELSLVNITTNRGENCAMHIVDNLPMLHISSYQLSHDILTADFIFMFSIVNIIVGFTMCFLITRITVSGGTRCCDSYILIRVHCFTRYRPVRVHERSKWQSKYP
jgi:hypothetical protein